MSSNKSYNQSRKQPKKYAGLLQKVVEVCDREKRPNLTEYEAKGVMEQLGINVANSSLARSPEEAVEITSEIGFPVVLKVVSPDIMHKTDAGCVKVGIRTQEEVKQTYEEILANAKEYDADADIHGVMIQEMAPAGEEIIVGGFRDEHFGPVVMFGLGGIFVEVYKDVSFRLCPVGREEALRMVQETKAYDILTGARGKEKEVESLLAVIEKISELMADEDRISEVDLNPLFLYDKGQGYVAVDSLITLTDSRQ